MTPLDPNLSSSLDRFLVAQEPVFETVLAELRDGKKTTHWMWFIFPQLRGLGRSSMAQYYGLDGIAEARQYLAHETLGPRLRQCTGVLLTTGTHSALEVFGSTDVLKFSSCMTLFAQVAEANSPFTEACLKYFESDAISQSGLEVPEPD